MLSHNPLLCFPCEDIYKLIYRVYSDFILNGNTMGCMCNLEVDDGML